MGTWNTRGLRGSTLEDLINRTNDSYREKKLALIQKIPTPITPIQIDKSSRHITLAYFDQKSTVDYIGAVQGFPYALMPRNAVHLLFLCRTSMLTRSVLWRSLRLRVGLPLLFLYYTGMDEIYYVPFRTIKHFWDRMEAGGRKSFTYDEIDHSWRIRAHRDMLVHYLEMIARDLELREGLEDAET